MTDDLAALLGYRRRELIGRDAWETTARPEPEPAIIDRLMADGHVSGVSQWLTREGARIDTVYAAQVVNGGELYVVHAAPLREQVARSVAVAYELRARALAAVARSHELQALGWMTKEEAAEYARCSTDTVERAVHDRKLRAGGTPGLRLFRREWLDAWLGGGLLLVTLAALALAAGAHHHVRGKLGRPMRIGVTFHKNAHPIPAPRGLGPVTAEHDAQQRQDRDQRGQPDDRDGDRGRS